MAENIYEISNIEEIPSPSLAVYPSLIVSNIKSAIQIAGKNILRPHIKTCKTPDVVMLMMAHGINRFKCATISEADMLGMIGAGDVILASQPVPLSMDRLKSLVKAYPGTEYSCIVDNIATLKLMEEKFEKMNVFIDLNVGMNRTGIKPEDVNELTARILKSENVSLSGIHAYNGKNHDIDNSIRERIAREGYMIADEVRKNAEAMSGRKMELVIGGSPDFMINAGFEDVQCSPGTFIFWDSGYARYTEMPFKAAAVLITRVISIIDKNLLCLDLGHKGVGPENPLNQRVAFLNVDNAEPVGQSEEHLVMKVPDTSVHQIGETWYGIPFHICPTVALYNELEVIENGKRTNQWNVIARDRKLNY